MTEGRKAGRPTSLTPEVQATVLAYIRAGNYRHVAAAAAGIHRHTLQSWERWGSEGKEPYAGFVAELQRVEAEAEAILLAEVREGGDKWQSKAWMLERRFATRWCARVRQHIAEELGQLTEKLRKTLDQDTYRRVADAAGEAAEAAGSPPSH